ncbi:hypothetical protein Ctob_004130 [Chrysochromulina tobinii]|uniref:Uncharacterized protein n=1 Tax=Chrysochromulina tobinii TaxID=1460289 RepID=A0A0M0JLB9_9EUKA|nr:hypothetical protein Ctob_004130 [Chrysochromulina tobinii]|eukprot:KOO27043.1 hypothetical protein Ctob_004130 [Chrysochromulina sp. CCMP291]
MNSYTRPRNQEAPLNAEATPRSWDLNEIAARLPHAGTEPESEPGAQKKKKGVMSKLGGLHLFPKKKLAEVEASNRGAAVAAAAMPEHVHLFGTSREEAAAADVDTLLVIMIDATLPVPKRVDAAKAISTLVQRVAREVGATAEPAADSIKDGSLALRLVDVLGAVSEPPVQAALCHAIWLLAVEDRVKDALAGGGGILYLGALLSSSDPTVQQEVTLLLITVITTETACQQLVAADGVRPLLALISLPERELPNVAQTRSCALHLISRICAHNGAPALLAAGAAVPVIREMMRAAMIANWTGRTGSADAVDSRAAAEASKDAGQALSVLAAFGAIGDSGVEAVRHAVRQASALPALVALLACRQEEVHKAAATILALLDPTDKAQLTVLENSGGITLLCETLVSTSAAEATHLQAMQALATLSAAPTSAVAIAEYPRALATYVNIIVAPPTETAKAAALTTLANLSSLGALSLEPLRSLPFQSALAGVIMATKGRAHGGAQTEARTAALGLLAKVSEDRLCRRELVLLNLPPALSMAISEGGEGARHATHALSHFAADDTFRLQLASWGALPPLAQQLSASTQLDARTRAMALSALANFSYVDPTALSAVPGVLATLGRLLFEQDAAVLTMALTALSNLVGFAETVAPALLAAGTPRAVHALLSHNDHHVVEQSLATLLKLSGDRALAGAFVEVPGAITSVVFLIGSSALAQAGAVPLLIVHMSASEPNAAVPLAAALGAMLESWPEARGAALEAGGAAALGTALLGCTEADGRTVLALTLAAVVRGDVGAAQAACGWQGIIAVLVAAAATVSTPLRELAAAAEPGLAAAVAGASPKAPGTAQPAAAPAVGEAVTKPKPLVGPQAVKMLAYDDEKPQPVRTSLKSRPAATDLD